ncbi:MAG: serpin family protein [Acidimicrobiia bacterium]|nr:serpin family protein [Acidimicrobiia bacterium]
MARTARSRRRTLPVALLGAVGLAAAACGGGAGASAASSTSGGDETTGPPVPAQAPGPTESTPPAQQAVVGADRHLATELYRELAAGEDGNLFFSPHSIALALSMVEPGAAGATADQLRALLCITTDSSSWHDTRHHLDQQVNNPEAGPAGFEALRLGIANGAFGQAGFPIEAAYLDRLAQSYGAALEPLDFVADPEAGRAAVNAWVAERTEDHITDLLPEGSVTDLTRLVLANAVFFSGNWLTSFDEARTAPAAFTARDGSTVQADTMHGSVRTDYVAGEGWAAVRLPYAGGYSMRVVVPDEGRFADVEARIGDVLGTVRHQRGDHQVELSLPKFAFAAEADLVPALQRLGLVDVFDPELADLSGIVVGPAGEDLHVSGAFHQATVAVDEEGTVATAATGLVVGATSMPPPATLDVDRAFLVAIEQDSTGELLFLGRVLDPTA